MSFENVYRSREGTREITKIANFIGKLVIKNEYEAKACETTESVSEYYKYYGAYTKHDNFDDYSLNDREYYHNYVLLLLTDKGYTQPVINNLKRKSVKFLKENEKVQVIKDYLWSLRVARVMNYDEKNFYYRQFLGKPNTKNDVINVKNLDSDAFELIPIHTVTEKKYPNTYTYYFLQDNIQTLINKYPNLNYLRFINSTYSPFYLRSLPNYSIIRYQTGLLNSTELSFFMKSYNKAKTEVLLDYIDGFDSKQPLYNVLMIQNLLYYTIINYSNSYIERFSLCDYTNENVDHILRSYGYDNLTRIESNDLKQRIVKNINDLIYNKANNYILELILDKIIQTEGNELKRYYVEKQYETDDHLAISIDTGKSLENSVKLTLKEAQAVTRNELSTNDDDIYVDYDSFTYSDDLWGGINESDSQAIKEEKKAKLKKQILKLNFNSILTRYITLTRTIDILEAQRNLRDSLYLMLKYFEINNSSEFFIRKINFDSFQCTPSALFAAMCWLQQMKFYEDSDIIIKNQMLINSTAVFRSYGKSVTDQEGFERTFIKNGKVMYSYDITPELLDWNVVDFLKNDDEISTIQIGKALNYELVSADGFKHNVTEYEDIGDYVTKYRFYENGMQLGDVTSNTTFEELISDYKNQYPKLIERIGKKLKDSYDFNTYQAWLFLLNQSRKDNSIYGIFKNATRYTEYIKNECESSELITWIQKEVIDKNTGKKDFDKICKTLSTINNAFKDWVKNSFSTLVYESETDSDEDSYVSDMIILFNEFLSTYSELYNVDYKYTFGNTRESNENALQLFYNPLYCHFTDKYTDDINLRYEEYTKLLRDCDDYIKLNYSQSISIADRFEEAINNELEYDRKTKKYSVIPLLYKETIKFHDFYTDLANLKEEIGINVHTSHLDSISLKEDLKITYKN